MTQTTRMALIQRLLDGGFPWMKFPGGLEHEFLTANGAQRRRHFIVSSLIALLVFNGFLIVDYLMLRDVFQLAAVLRLGVFTPICISSLVLIWHLPTVRALWVLDALVLISGLLAAATLAYVLSITHSPMSVFYHVGFTVVIVYGNIVQRLRFWYAMVFSLVIFCMHVVGIVLLPIFSERLLLPIMSMVAGTAIFSLTANYALERDERRRFLLTLRERELVGRLSEINLKLQELSRVDVLTELFNRRHFQEYLQDAWSRARGDGGEVAIIMIDVDHFKAYNDHYGHPAGDKCLRQVAAALQASLRRPGDMVARFGGEEFIAVLPQTSLAVAVQAAERIRKAVEGLAMPHEKSDTAPVLTVSVGVACSKADGALASPDALISEADQALYRAKHQGRNLVCAAEQS
ncbi:MAG: GGDEF domain-containing protein [Burkholderiales bacterium]|nr:GGDEF domain-containing protein [Burkholderiales bacterium]